jgi:hypothetical protein
MKSFILVLVIFVLGLLAFLQTTTHTISKADLTSGFSTKVNIKARQDEAQDALRKLFQRQQNYFLIHKEYSDNLDTLNVKDFYPENRKCYYFFEVLLADSQSFQIRARGNIDKDKTLDIWIINQIGILQNILDDTKN